MPEQATHPRVSRSEILDSSGRAIPIVTFYSVQGGVGKSTLARRFGELVTVAKGQDGRNPNVALIDLDLGSSGLTVRFGEALRSNFSQFRTVHEVIQERNVTQVQAINVTTAVALAGANPRRGQLYLVPSAQADAKKLFETMADIPREELLKLLTDMVQSVVIQYGIDCVIIDCAPADSPYAAAAATLATIPLFIGRNDAPSFEGIRRLPERFREMYPQFQPSLQRVIINAVSVKALFDVRAEQHAVFDYIPLTSDVIHETEGLSGAGSFRMLLFEKYVVDIIRQVFIGKQHLIPEAPEIVGEEWIGIIARLGHAERAPKIVRYLKIGRVKWFGVGIAALGLLLIALRQFVESSPEWLWSGGMFLAVAGLVLAIVAWHCAVEGNRTLSAARLLFAKGPDEVLTKLARGESDRQSLEEMKQLAKSIPAGAAS